jgi:hypothetical protein
MLTPERSSRLVAQKAVDPSLPGLGDVIDRLVAAGFDAPVVGAYQAEVRRSIGQVVVSRLIDLADATSVVQVRATAVQKLRRLQSRFSSPAASASADAPVLSLLASDIDRYLKRPAEPARRIAAPGTPPGAPIGDSPWQYLIGDPACQWIK